MPDARDADAALDPDLLRRFVDGDAGAFHRLFLRFEQEVYRWVLRVVREPAAAEEVAVEAFWRAYRGRARYDPARPLGAWLRRIATNAARDHLRGARARQVDDPARADGAAAERLSAPQGTDPDLRDAVRRAFATLPPALRVVAALALVEQRPYAEIGEALDVPVGTVKSRVFRAVRLLRAELERLGYGRGG